MENKKIFSGTLTKFLLITIFFYPLTALALKDDRTQPIKITADRAERDEKLGITLYHGNVVIRQGSILIEADTVTIKTHISPLTSREELEEIVTIGAPSRLQQQLETNNEMLEAVAKTIRYDVNTDSVTMIENALLKQGERVVTGDRITYDVAAEKVIADAEKAAGNPKDRVTVTIPPKSTTAK